MWEKIILLFIFDLGRSKDKRGSWSFPTPSTLQGEMKDQKSSPSTVNGDRHEVTVTVSVPFYRWQCYVLVISQGLGCLSSLSPGFSHKQNKGECLSYRTWGRMLSDILSARMWHIMHLVFLPRLLKGMWQGEPIKESGQVVPGHMYVRLNPLISLFHVAQPPRRETGKPSCVFMNSLC